MDSFRVPLRFEENLRAGSGGLFLYFHLVCSPEFFAVASERKSARKFFRRSLELMVLKNHEFGQKPYIPPLCLSSMPLSCGHITLYREAGNGDVLGSLWVSQTQVVCVRKR